jgi:uncharacterized BrkB/YihY/UPF0761 family membrane protein
MLLMLWLYLTGIALLVGAEINREIGRAGSPRRSGPGGRRGPGRTAA